MIGSSENKLDNMLHWFDDREAFLRFENGLDAPWFTAQRIASQPTSPGVCSACQRTVSFQVDGGARFSDRPNLREGMLCPRCRLTARQRTLLQAFRESVPDGGDVGGLMLERWSRLFREVARRHPRTIGSEYLAGDRKAGRRYLWHPPGRPWRMRYVRHESITGFSFPDASLDFICHSDVLEHVADTQSALRECRRVLKPGKPMIFTVPFFSRLDSTVVRGVIDRDGTLVQLMPAEYHGDGLKSEGIYTFYNFGWDFFTSMKSVFARVQIGACHAPEHGLLYADSIEGTFNMLPIVFRVYR